MPVQAQRPEQGVFRAITVRFACFVGRYVQQERRALYVRAVGVMSGRGSTVLGGFYRGIRKVAAGKGTASG